MPSITSYRDLLVWQASMDLVDTCFDLVEALPPRYRFIFCNQILRAAPDPMLLRVRTLGDSVGRMLHGLVRSLEARHP